MSDPTPPDPDAGQLSLDVFLRDILPEVKLALGEHIDRENVRALPGRYARLLPETLLILTLRPDVAGAITPIAAELERELTDSCTRHGSLYDRVYRAQLRRAPAPDVPLFSVTAHAGHDLASAAPAVPAASDHPAAASPSAAAPSVPAAPAVAAEATGGGDTLYAIPMADPDATRAEGIEPTGGWDAGRWMLVVEDVEGVEQEVFRLTDPFITVGRRSSDPQLHVTIGLSDVPHVSRRQLALLWQGEDPEPRFQVYNLGLNPLHIGDRDVSGARVGRGTLRLEALDAAHMATVGVGARIRIGDQGPVLIIQEVPGPAEDPEATQYE